MNKVRSLFLILAILVAMVVPTGAALAQSGGVATKEATVTGATVPVRAEADPNAEILTSIYSGDVVEVLSEGDVYSLVRVTEGDTVIEGYALSFSLDIRIAQLNLAATTATRSELAFYAEPSLSSDVIATLPNNASVAVLYIDGVWARVVADGFAGWTFAADLSINPDPAAFDNFLVDQAFANVSGASALAIYDAPSISANVITTVARETELLRVFVTDDNLFAFVILPDGTTGYAFRADVTVTTPRAVGTGTLTEDRVLFRSAPEQGDNIIRPLALGEEVLVIDVSDDFRWYEVRIGEEEGYVSTQFVDTDAFDLSIAGIAELAGFDTLLAAVGAADPAVAAALTDPASNLTVFAPTNEAFEALGEETLNAVLADQEQLTGILLYHVIDGGLLAADVVAAAGTDGQLTATTLQGGTLDITIDADGNVFVNGIQVISFDIQAENGVIHVIEGVLLPE